MKAKRKRSTRKLVRNRGAHLRATLRAGLEANASKKDETVG